MTDNEIPQIVIDDDANATLFEQLWAGVRQFAPPAMAFLLGRGLIQNDVAIVLGVAGAVIWPIVAGQIKTRHRMKQLLNIAKNRRVPNSIVTTKSEAAAAATVEGTTP